MYGKRYIIQGIGIANVLYTCELWENGYAVTTVDTIEADFSTFDTNLLAQNDNPFLPLLSSELKLNLNITEFLGTLPDLTSLDDRKYWVKLYTSYQPPPGRARIYWQNYQTPTDDSNISIFVNGVQVVQEFLSNQGYIEVNAGDIVEFLQNFFGPVPGDSPTWTLQLQGNGIDIYNNSTTVPGTPTTNYYYLATAQSQYVYSVLAKSANATFPGPSIRGIEQFYIWQGFVLTDAATVPFNTGFVGLSLSCTDGLALLKDIPYVPTNRDINVLESLKTVVLNCLNKIAYPEGFFLNICVSIFASGMSDRGTNTIFEPLGQSYYPPRNWLLSDLTYMNCYDVLITIMSGWGCQLKQSNSEFIISQINEQCANIYYTRVDQAGAVLDSGLKVISRTIVPYTDTADLYFVEGSQAKILRKGFAALEIDCPAAYAPQIIDNGDMAILSAGFPIQFNSPAVGSVTGTTLGPYKAIKLQPTGGGPTQRTPQVSSVSNAPVLAGDQINLAFLIDGQATPSPTVPKCWLRIIITTPAVVNWWLDSTNNWVSDAVTPIGNYNVIGSTSGTYESVSVTTPPAPATGTLAFIWLADNFDTEVPTIAHAVATFISPFQRRLVKNTVTGNQPYTHKETIVMGGASESLNFAQKGSLLTSAGVPWTNWYRYGVTENYIELLRLIFQNKFNVIAKSSINLDGTIMSLFSLKTGDTNTTYTEPFSCFTVTDGTGKYSVTGKFYQVGNANNDAIRDDSKLTLLEISNTDIAATITDTVILKSDVINN